MTHRKTDKCWICCKDLSNITCVVQANVIKNRKIKGNKPLMNFPVPVKYDKCIICKQKTEYEITTSIYHRKHFLSGIGQFCTPCYMATTNTGMVMREFYEDYLF